MEKGLDDPAIARKAEGAGVAVRYQGPEALGKTVAEETAYWGRIIKAAGIVAN